MSLDSTWKLTGETCPLCGGGILSKKVKKAMFGPPRKCENFSDWHVQAENIYSEMKKTSSPTIKSILKSEIEIILKKRKVISLSDVDGQDTPFVDNFLHLIKKRGSIRFVSTQKDLKHLPSEDFHILVSKPGDKYSHRVYVPREFVTRVRDKYPMDGEIVLESFVCSAIKKYSSDVILRIGDQGDHVGDLFVDDEVSDSDRDRFLSSPYTVVLSVATEVTEESRP